MAGFRKQICLLILLFFSLFALNSQAQTNNGRVEHATLINDELRLQVSVPRGRTIEIANIQLDGDVLELRAAPVPSELVLWLVLDQSESVLNTASVILTGVNRFLDGFDESVSVGLILYNNDIATYLPSSNRNEVESWLSSYSGRANSANCLNTALEAVQSQIEASSAVNRVLVLAGSLVRQNTCPNQPPNLNIPLDLLIISDSIDDEYQELQDSFGGLLLRANLQTVTSRLDEIKFLWTNPVYELSGIYTGTNLSGDLELILSDGAVLEFDIDLVQIKDIAETALATTSNLSALGDLVTQVPSALPQTEVATEIIAPTETEITELAELLETSEAELIETNPEATIAPETSGEALALIPTNAENRTSLAIASPSPQAESGSNNPDEPPTSLFSNPLVIVLLALVSILTLGGLFFAITRNARKPKTKALSQQLQIAKAANEEFDIYAQTTLDATQLEFVEPNTNIDEFDITEMFETKPKPIMDIFEVTEIVTEEDLLAKPKTAVLALLKDTTNNNSYEIRRPFTILGRQATCQIVISNDRGISREHLRFVIQEDDQILVEILSQNPVHLNGEHMENFSILKIGDTLKLSTNTEFTLINTTQGEKQ